MDSSHEKDRSLYSLFYSRMAMGPVGLRLDWAICICSIQTDQSINQVENVKPNNQEVGLEGQNNSQVQTELQPSSKASPNYVGFC